ncbi:hypothetical protein GCM10028857_27880 [Salinarchaeum chitinilyticum]
MSFGISTGAREARPSEARSEPRESRERSECDLVGACSDGVSSALGLSERPEATPQTGSIPPPTLLLESIGKRFTDPHGRFRMSESTKIVLSTVVIAAVLTLALVGMYLV